MIFGNLPRSIRSRRLQLDSSPPDGSTIVVAFLTMFIARPPNHGRKINAPWYRKPSSVPPTIALLVRVTGARADFGRFEPHSQIVIPLFELEREHV